MVNESSSVATEAVVSQTALASADHFIAVSEGEEVHCSKIAAFFDLLNLIDYAVWYEKLWFVTGSWQGLTSPRLTKLLADVGILGELDPREVDPQIGMTVADWVSRATRNDEGSARIRKMALSALDLDSKNQAQSLFGSLHWGIPVWDLDPGWSDVAAAVNEQSAENLAITIVRDLRETATGCVEEGASLIRTVFMWSLAQHHHMGICVEATRVSVVNSLFESVYTSLGRDFYSHIAKAFKATVEELFDADKRQILYIPPLSTLVLRECQGGKSLGDALVKVREEMTPLRQQVAALEASRENCASLKELMHEDRRFHEWLREMRKQYSHESDVSMVERGIPHVGELLKPLARPDEIANFTASFIEKPLEAARRWWIKRPVSHLFSLKQKLFAIRGYCELAHQSFGVEFTREEMIAYRYYSSLWELLPFSRLEVYRPKHPFRG